jgi:H+/gluconate symporter-like permease
MGLFGILLGLGALFGKLMEDSGSVAAIACFMTEKLGVRRAVLAVVLAGALVTYGGVSLFVAFFVLAPMAQALFRAADIPRRLMPATIALGTTTFTMTALPGTPAIQNTIPMPFFGTTPKRWERTDDRRPLGADVRLDAAAMKKIKTYAHTHTRPARASSLDGGTQ